MNYYYIVEELNSKYKPGIYGRRKIDTFELEGLNTKLWQYFVPVYSYYAAGRHLYAYSKNLFSIPKDISLQITNTKNKQLIFPSKSLAGYFDINSQKELFHGLFDDDLLKKNGFKTMMESNNQVNLIIVSRNDLPKDLIHFGGDLGVFDLGLYCSHPKNNKLLLPVKNYNDTISDLIINEIISAYQFLGAKKIVIEDVTEISGKSDNRTLFRKVNLQGKLNRSTLLEKHYGDGIYNPEMALKSNYFIRDFPSIMNTINSRIHGNIISDKMVKEINLSLGLELGIIKIFNSKSEFNYERKWRFEVDFFDKNEIVKYIL